MQSSVRVLLVVGFVSLRVGAQEEVVQSGAGMERLIAPGAKVEELASGLKFCEGPVWLPREDKLVFSDIPAAKLMEWSETGGLKVFREAANPNGNLLDLEGRLLTCQHGARNLVRTEADGTITVLADRYDGRRFNSPNDVAVHADGSLWFTDPPWGLVKQTEGREIEGNWVYRLDPATGKVEVVLRELAMPNGIAFSPDCRRLYVADTGGHRSHPDEAMRELPPTVSAWDVVEGRALAPEPVWVAPIGSDGMCVDVDGNLYTTSGRVTVLRPDGSRLGIIEVPQAPANVCFGGEDFRTLFITARTSLYSIRMRVAGSRPEAPQPVRRKGRDKR